MKRIVPFLLVASLAAAGVLVAQQGRKLTERSPSQHQGSPVHRVVSLAPSVTETLFALGAGKEVVGVTRYCAYPPEATRVTQVGGYIDPSFEAIVRLKPDLVIVTKGSNENAERITKLGISALSVDHNSIGGIIDSLSVIGRSIGREKEAESLTKSLTDRLKKVKQGQKAGHRPSTLISIGRSMGSDVDEIYVAGKDNFYDEMIALAGGENAFDSAIFKTPALSIEGIRRLDPEVIFDLQPGKSSKELRDAEAAWSKIPDLKAVKRGQVYALPGDYTVIPGPRFILMLEEMAMKIRKVRDGQ